MKIPVLFILGFFVILGSCNRQIHYDMRTDLEPQRLTIAMWDYSWLNQHYTGGFFEDFNKVTDELVERGFNTVRIEAFPFIIDRLDSINQKVTIRGNPSATWGASDIDRKHDIAAELISFIKTAEDKGLYVILSTWNPDCLEFPNLKENYTNRDKYQNSWKRVLNILGKNDLLDHVIYVDIDQEFPNFSPFKTKIDELADSVKPSSELLEKELAKHNSNDLIKLDWNQSQMIFIHDLLQETLMKYQIEYPDLRFTFSFTDHWDEFRAMNLNLLDVLELHIWMEQSERFNTRTRFNDLERDRGVPDYKEYAGRVNKTMSSIRPMLLKDMHNRLAYGKAWSEELGAPLTTSEAWGPWWHMDHNDLDWKWLYDWCEEGMKLSALYGFWGSTPWNFSHPYWENWKNKAWYNQVNSDFIDN